MIRPYSAAQKKEYKINFCASQIRGWESFRNQAKDPCNLLTAIKEINNLRKQIAELMQN